MQRRTFLKTTAGTSLAAAISPNLFALAADNPFRKNVGIQLYTLRKEIGKDTAGTIAAVAAAGYKQVEVYGFPNPKAIEMIKAAKDNGLAVNSTHFNWDCITNPDKKGVTPFAKIIETAKEHGLTHLVMPYLHGHNRKTLDDYKRVAGQLNKAAVEAKTAGIQLAYHNHAFEYKPMEGGKSGYQVFIEEFDKDMMFEVDVFWVVVGGADPVKQIQELKGRVSQLHLKDLRKGFKAPNFGKVAKTDFEEIGDGMIDMDAIMTAAVDVGVAHAHVEQDQSPDALASIRQSIKAVKAM
jgi:sugar phosphate isomerase/epimerase